MALLIHWHLPQRTALHPAVRPPKPEVLEIGVPGLGDLSDEQVMALAVLILLVDLVLGSVF